MVYGPVMATVQRGFLVLADLTGYTAYLSRGELAHAPVIAGDLLGTIVGRLEPPFRLAKFEGDAAFLFVEDGRAEPSLLLDAIEASYLAFRRRLRSIETATACDCQACALAPRLDLKVFVHHGEFLRSRIAGRDELAGAEVILAHRLLKGAAEARSMGHGFALFTSAAAGALGLDPEAMGLDEGRESIEHLGDVRTYALDLERRWAAETEQRRIGVGDAPALVELEVRLATPPAAAWAHLTSPALRTRWEGPIEFTETATGGRRGIGTTTRCVTGRLATIEEVVDWQPFEHVGRRIAVPGIGPVDASLDLEAVDGGTLVRWSWWRGAREPVDAAAVDRVRAEMEVAFERLRRSTDRGLEVVDQVEAGR
jgi:hypothetical protein